MAADQTQVQIDLAVMIVNQAGNLMNAIEEFGNIYGWGTSAGITFQDSVMETQAALKHAVGANYNQVAGVVLPALTTWLKAQTISGGDLNGKTYWEALQMLRRNGS